MKGKIDISELVIEALSPVFQRFSVKVYVRGKLYVPEDFITNEKNIINIARTIKVFIAFARQESERNVVQIHFSNVGSPAIEILTDWEMNMNRPGFEEMASLFSEVESIGNTTSIRFDLFQTKDRYGKGRESGLRVSLQ